MEQILAALVGVSVLILGIILLVIFLAVTGIIYLFYTASKKADKQEREDSKFKEEQAAELARMNLLPKLNTTWLMSEVTGPRDREEAIKQRQRRTFAVKSYWIQVTDETGRNWTGFCMDETLKSLRDGEFAERDEPATLRGSLHQFTDSPVTIDGHTTFGYPRDLNPLFTDTPEWRRWIKLEKEFNTRFPTLDAFQRKYDEILTPAHLQRMRENKQKFRI